MDRWVYEGWDSVSATPIGDHALLSDCRSAALVTNAGSVDWLCFPRFDSPAVFGRLLDDEAGHWSIAPMGDVETSRRYVAESMVLETTFRTTDGVVVLTDALATGGEDRGHALGAGSPHVLTRRLVCSQGEVEVGVEYRPRPEYGLVTPVLSSVTEKPLLSSVKRGFVARGGAGSLVLSTPADLENDGSGASGRVRMRAGETLGFALHSSTVEQGGARLWSQRDIADSIDATVEAWGSWSRMHQTYDGRWRDLVHHSGRVLQALTFQPTGAIVAAATTSLPEDVGGDRNWDYRYCWVRDASLTMRALWIAACPEEASGFFSFMATAAAGSLGSGVPLQIMFGVGGEHDLSERSLPHLDGWRHSRPVRVGNDAWKQQQNDVYGELLDAADRFADNVADFDAETRAFLVSCADAVVTRWTQKGQGIWEVRGAPRHYLHSKLMCWVALDRAIRLAEHIGGQERVADWTRTRRNIRDAVLTEGWCERAGAFTQYFGSDEVDASALMMSIVGFLPAHDPRLRSTIDAIEERLTDQRGLVYRYRTDDGLAAGEGTFLLCTFWLAHALANTDQVDRARAVFERTMSYVNDVGLFAEEVDSESGELLGNFPQAFSHVGLVNAAEAIRGAEHRMTKR